MIDAIQQPKQRLQWLDALRGFTMVMVVTNHVYGQGFDTNTKYSMFMSLCLMFRMPLFFFISGFLAYKASFTWDLASTSRLLNKKLRVQIIPTLVFMTAHIALCGKVFWEGMQGAWESPTKGGYWFTLVLLQMFIVYYAVCFPFHRQPLWIHMLSEKTQGHVYKIMNRMGPSNDELWKVRFITRLNRYFIYPILHFLCRLSRARETYALGIPYHDPRHMEDTFPLTEATFEGHSFPVPKDADAALTLKYGDYMRLPNIEDINLHVGTLTIED